MSSADHEVVTVSRNIVTKSTQNESKSHMDRATWALSYFLSTKWPAQRRIEVQYSKELRLIIGNNKRRKMDVKVVEEDVHSSRFEQGTN